MTVISQDWVSEPGVQQIFDLLGAERHAAYFVGGCVRNALLELPVIDIDIATAALPPDVIRLCTGRGLRALPTGIDHGTITVIANGRTYEITTFRKDVETDGRRAVVRFSTDIADDARRRDFTINALYADRHGSVFDPLGGMEDLAACRVRFIDNPSERIKEDYLRILRYFRIHSLYGDADAGMDGSALAAISENLVGLETLSAERIGAEFKKLLSSIDPGPAVAAMAATGVLAHVLPGADHAALAPLVHLEAARSPDPIRRLAALGGPDPTDRLRLSKSDVKRWKVLRDMIAGTEPVTAMAYRHGAELAVSGALVRAAVLGQSPPDGIDAAAASGAARVFPLSAGDLMPALSGAALGAALKALEARWISSDFQLTKLQLLAAHQP